MLLRPRSGSRQAKFRRARSFPPSLPRHGKHGAGVIVRSGGEGNHEGRAVRPPSSAAIAAAPVRRPTGFLLGADRGEAFVFDNERSGEGRCISHRAEPSCGPDTSERGLQPLTTAGGARGGAFGRHEAISFLPPFSHQPSHRKELANHPRRLAALNFAVSPRATSGHQGRTSPWNVRSALPCCPAEARETCRSCPEPGDRKST